MRKRLNILLFIWRKEHVMYLLYGIGVCLFVLFFQPFSDQPSHHHNSSIIAISIAGIVLLSILVVRTFYPCLTANIPDINQESVSVFKSSIIIWALSSISCSLYLYSVEFVEMTYYLLFKVVIVCISAPVILVLSDRFVNLKMKNELLIQERKNLQNISDGIKEKKLNSYIEFVSNNGFENFCLLSRDILFIKSADNYVEIHYIDKDRVKMKLIRKTLRNIGLLIKQYPNIIKCHRTCIVNINHINKLKCNRGSHYLIMENNEIKLPVSRLFLQEVKESIELF